MRKRLIVNADDIGISRRVTDAILDCHARGIVTSTTLMANMPATEYACEKAADHPGLGVGLHLNLTEGRPLSPVSDVPDLVGDDGAFRPLLEQIGQLWVGARVADQVERELTRQVERALELGIRPTHFDSHHGVQKRPLVRRALLRIGERFGIRAARTHRGRNWAASAAPWSVRADCAWRNLRALHRDAMVLWNHFALRRGGMRTPERKLSPSLLRPGGEGRRAQLLAAIDALPPGTTEMLVHPGYHPDPELDDPPGYWKEREEDRELAMDPAIREAIRRADVELVHFGDLG